VKAVHSGQIGAGPASSSACIRLRCVISAPVLAPSCSIMRITPAASGRPPAVPHTGARSRAGRSQPHLFAQAREDDVEALIEFPFAVVLGELGSQCAKSRELADR